MLKWLEQNCEYLVIIVDVGSVLHQILNHCEIVTACSFHQRGFAVLAYIVKHNDVRAHASGRRSRIMNTPGLLCSRPRHAPPGICSFRTQLLVRHIRLPTSVQSRVPATKSATGEAAGKVEFLVEGIGNYKP